MSTPIYQEALIEAKKLREAATAEAKNAVLEAVSPIIKQMIDREIASVDVILEQQEPTADGVDMSAPPTAPAAPSPDAGTVPPIQPAPAPGAEVTSSQQPVAPAVAAASPPIVPAGGQVLGKIETSPTGEQELVVPIASLFQPASPAVDTAIAGDPLQAQGEPPVPPSDVAPPSAAPGTPDLTPPPAEDEPTPAQPAGLAEVYRLVSKLLAEQTIVPGSTDSANVPGPGEVTKSVASMVSPATVAESYGAFKAELELCENAVRSARDNRKVDALPAKDKVVALYENLLDLKANKGITDRLFTLNESRLELLHENLAAVYSYLGNSAETRVKDIQVMKKQRKDSLKEFALALFEGAEGFEKQVGKVEPAGDSKGIKDEHAKSTSGNPKGVKAEAEKAPFATKKEEGDQGKALLEQLEEEINELMSQVSADEGDDLVLELSGSEDEPSEPGESEDVLVDDADSEDVGAADEVGEIDDSLTLTIDLEGVSGDSVENVNVSIDGTDMSAGAAPEEEMPVDDMVDAGGEADGLPADEDDASAALQEVRKLVREQLEQLGFKPKTAVASKPQAQATKATPKTPVQSRKPAVVNESVLVKENQNLAKQLDETRLLTARSLYLNKIFVSEAKLSEVQKRKVVEYLDTAKTVSEAKEIYNRIVRVLNNAQKKGVVSESANQPVVIAESAEPSFDTSRWSKLAGIKKSG